MVNLRQEFTPLSSVSFCSSAYNDCSEVSWDDMKLAGDNTATPTTTTTTNGSATTKAQQLLSHLSSASTQEIHQALIKYSQTKEHELRAVTAKLSKLQIEHDALKLLSLTSDLEASEKQDYSASIAAATAATTTTSSTAAPQNNTTTTTTTQQRFSLPRLNRSRSQRAIHNSFNSAASGSMQLLIDTNGKLMAENYKLETSVNGLRRSLSSYIRLSKQCEVSDKETIHKLERENKELKMRHNNNLNNKNDVEIVAANTALQQLGLSVNDIPHDVDNPFAGGGEKLEEEVVALALDSPSSTVDERKKEKKMAITNGDDEMKKKMMTVSVKSLYIPHRTMRRTTSVTACLDDESDVTWEEEYGYDEEEDSIVLEARHAQSNEEGGGNDITVDELLYNEMMAISASNNHHHDEDEDDDDEDVRKHSNALLVDFDGDRRSRRRESTKW